MAEQPIGSILDGLDISFDLDDGDLMSDALVIAKVLRANGTVSLAITSSDATSWLDRLGMVTAASEIIRTEMMYDCMGDDGDN